MWEGTGEYQFEGNYQCEAQTKTGERCSKKLIGQRYCNLHADSFGKLKKGCKHFPGATWKNGKYGKIVEIMSYISPSPISSSRSSPKTPSPKRSPKRPFGRSPKTPSPKRSPKKSPTKIPVWLKKSDYFGDF